MDNNKPQTSFIPNEVKPRVNLVPRWQNVLLIASLIIFVGSILFAVLFFILRKGDEQTNLSYENSITRAKERFDSGLSVKTLEQFDTRLRSANDLLKKHKSF